MGIEDVERRLAAHAVVPEERDQADTAEDEEPSEPAFQNVAELLKVTRGVSEPTVIGLKRIGALVDDGETFVYTLHKPLKVPAGTTKVRIAKDITARHKRQMFTFGEHRGPTSEDPEGNDLVPYQAVLLSWVGALTGLRSSVIDNLSYYDADALMSIVQWIEGDQGNR